MRIVPLAALSAQVVPMAGGRAGVSQTLRAMRQAVNIGKVDPLIRAAAINVVQFSGNKDYAAEAASLFEFVRDSIRYVRDVHGVETLASARKTLEIEAGDCDDKTTLLAAMLESVGHPTRFVISGYKNPPEFEHVYLQTWIGGQWIDADPTEPHYLGWAAPNPTILAFEKV